MIRRWVTFWDRREHPRSLAAVRIALGLVVLVDLLQMGWLDLVVPLMGTGDAGGIGVPLYMKQKPALYALLPAGVAGAWTLWSMMVGAALFLVLGVVPRFAALALLLLSAQFALALPSADRGIDMLIRNTLAVLVLSSAGDTASVMARVRFGSVWAPEDHRVPAWPRYLIALQLVLVYAAAGISKVASSWTPVGGFGALFIAMSDPHFQRLPDDVIRAAYPLTQVGTAVSWLWEWASPVLLLAWWYRETADRGGRLRAWMNRWPVIFVYLTVGAVFHVGTHATLRLGIFPFAMLSLYPSWVRPDHWAVARARIARLTDRWRT